METRQFAGRQLSRLMLGTVQLGLPYGIANKTGQPSYQEARDILACAYEGGSTAWIRPRSMGPVRKCWVAR